jgi:hypothetical protein
VFNGNCRVDSQLDPPGGRRPSRAVLFEWPAVPRTGFPSALARTVAEVTEETFQWPSVKRGPGEEPFGPEIHFIEGATAFIFGPPADVDLWMREINPAPENCGRDDGGGHPEYLGGRGSSWDAEIAWPAIRGIPGYSSSAWSRCAEGFVAEGGAPPAVFWRGFAPEMPTLMVGVAHGAHLFQGDGKFAFPSGSVLGIL